MDNLIYITDIWFRRWEDEKDTPYYIRLWYRFKGMMCLLLDRNPGDIYDERGLFENLVQVAVLDGGISPGTDTHPAIYWCEYIGVGSGVFRNWWAVVDSVSSD